MNFFEIHTAALSNILIIAACMTAITFVWLQNRGRFAGLGYWVTGYGMVLAAVSLIALRGITSDLLTIAGSYALYIGGSILMLMGLERFLHKRGLQIHNVAVLVVSTFLIAYFVSVNPVIRAPLAILSGALLLIFGQGAWLAFRRVDVEMRPVANGVGVVFLIACLINLARIVVFFAVPSEEAFFYSSGYEALQLILSQVILVILTFGLVLMVNRRLILNLELDVAKRERVEERFRQVITSAPDAIFGVDEHGRILFANEAATRLLGYSSEEYSGMDIETLVPPRAKAKHQNQRSEFMAHPRTRPMGTGRELVAMHRDGYEIPVEISLSHVNTETSSLVIAFMQNITERKQLDQALQYRTHVLSALNQATLDLVDRHEMDDILHTLLVRIGALLEAPDLSFDLVENEDTLVTYAVTSEQPLKRGDTMRRGEGGWLSWQAIESGEPAVLEDYSTWPKRRALFEGFPIHAIMIVPVHQRNRVIGTINLSRREPNRPFNETDLYAARQLAQMVSLVLDNAAIYSQLQSQLAESVQREVTLQEAQTQVIEQQRTMATIDERQRMARDLHDSVNQSIHSLVLFTETLVASLDKQNITRARQISERLQESARQALKETRLLLYQTESHVEERGVDLIEQLNARLESVESRAGVRAQLLVEGSLENCPEAWRENLFWITIEALNNSLKHAQARSVNVLLRFDPTFVELEIADDGRGFDANTPNPGGYGLRNMRGRAERLGGALTLTSASDKGTRVLFRAEIQS